VLLLAALAAGCTPARPAADPAEAAAERFRTLIEEGDRLYLEGDFRMAARRYAAASAIAPDEPVVHQGLGAALARLGRDEEARAAFARARELEAEARPQR
jgi:Flp pilus assembly protein TadD